ncbi:hypothetical protein CWC03_22900 [Pseudoalteromonas sp. S2755]|nr:hypothetical protein CWC03_22900 [Pseudoalteromonas sp. S2755]
MTAACLAYVIYTSGSTGQPKGVMTPHVAVARLVIEQSFMELSAETVMLQSANIAFDAATLELWGPLLNRGQVVLYPHGYIEVEALNQAVEHYGVNTLWLTAGLFREWSLALPSTSPLQQVLAGGDVLDPAAIHRVQAQLPHVTLINGYGPTENTTFSTTYTFANPHTLALVPIGQKLATDHALILGPNGSLVPQGCVGELYVGGDGLARGYLNRPELTAERFVDNPYYLSSDPHSPSRLYRTGDLVRYLEGGNLAFIGRTDDQVKIRGFRIELGEVEVQLAQQPGVDSVLVKTLKWADSVQLVGYIKSNQVLDKEAKHGLVKDIKSKLAVTLPDYMVPSFLVVVDEWPLTANGKVDRKALPEPEGSALQGEYVAPVTEVEQKLVDIWSALLNIPSDTISTTANFLTLGGHSLLSIRLMSEIRQQFAVALPVQAVFDAENLAALATRINQSQGSDVRPAVEAMARTSSIQPVSFAQRRLWFIDQLQGGSAEYYMEL